MKKCQDCKKEIEDQEFIKHGHGFVCMNCVEQSEQEPEATVKFSDDSGDCPMDEGGSISYISAYTNNTPFKIEYIRTDGWRGYYKPNTPKGWTNLVSDNILAMSEDSKELEKFDQLLTEFLKSKGVIYAKVFCRSSNIFSTGFDIFVKTKDKNILELINKVSELKEIFRNEDRYLRTALTGASEKTDKDDLLIKCFRKLEKGEKLEDIKKELEKHIDEAKA